MEIAHIVFVFLLGTIVGSFLNVLIYRLHTGRSLGGRSHCMSCRKTLEWYELIPLFSYLFLQGRCKGCDSYIPYRYLLVELLTGVSYVLLFLYFKDAYILLGLHAVHASVLIVIAVYDLRHTIIPDELTLSVGGVALVILGYTAFLRGEWSHVLFDVLSGIAAGSFFYLLWRMSKGRWIGLGDAKLALPLGALAGASSALSMVVLSFWIGALVSVFLLLVSYLYRKGKTVLRFPRSGFTMKSEVPFAPFLILGFIAAYYLNANIFDITAFLFPFGAL